MNRVKFGCAVPNCCEGLIYPIPFANYESLVEISIEAESLGYDSVWANDHITTLSYLKEYTSKPPNFFEPLITLSFIAEGTRSIKLGTSVIVLPNRDVLLLAKQVSTLDVLSNGRVILGVGLGAYREEFEATNPKLTFNRRSEIMDEKLEALKAIFQGDEVCFEGKYVTFFNIESYPKPIQKPFPIWIGGNSQGTIKRVAKFGEGWLPAALYPNEVRVSKQKIEEYAKKFNRDTSKIDIAPTYVVCMSDTHQKAVKDFMASWSYKHLVSLKNVTLKAQPIETYVERNFIGTAEEIIQKINLLIDAGVTYFSDLVFPARNIKEFKKRIKLFAKEVMPSFT